MPLGVFEDATWGVEGQVNIDHGDLLVLYTDGITEAQNPQQELFGELRLRQAVRSTELISAGTRLSKCEQRFLAEIERFADGAPQSDDITLLVLARL